MSLTLGLCAFLLKSCMFDLLVTVNSTRRASLPLTMTNHYMKPGYLALDDATPLNPGLENNRRFCIAVPTSDYLFSYLSYDFLFTFTTRK